MKFQLGKAPLYGPQLQVLADQQITQPQDLSIAFGELLLVLSSLGVWLVS